MHRVAPPPPARDPGPRRARMAGREPWSGAARQAGRFVPARLPASRWHHSARRSVPINPPAVPLVLEFQPRTGLNVKHVLTSRHCRAWAGTGADGPAAGFAGHFAVRTRCRDVGGMRLVAGAGGGGWCRIPGHTNARRAGLRRRAGPGHGGAARGTDAVGAGPRLPRLRRGRRRRRIAGRHGAATSPRFTRPRSARRGTACYCLASG
jgi:hypothetical protein